MASSGSFKKKMWSVESFQNNNAPPYVAIQVLNPSSVFTHVFVYYASLIQPLTCPLDSRCTHPISVSYQIDHSTPNCTSYMRSQVTFAAAEVTTTTLVLIPPSIITIRFTHGSVSTRSPRLLDPERTTLTRTHTRLVRRTGATSGQP